CTGTQGADDRTCYPVLSRRIAQAPAWCRGRSARHDRPDHGRCPRDIDAPGWQAYPLAALDDTCGHKPGRGAQDRRSLSDALDCQIAWNSAPAFASNSDPPWTIRLIHVVDRRDPRPTPRDPLR